MISWKRLGPDGTWEPFDLNWLSMYPAFFSDTGRMAFVRLAKSRITYGRAFVRWTPPLQMKGVGRVISVRMPNEDLARRNLEVTVEGASGGLCKIELKLAGNEVQVANINPEGQSASSADLAIKLAAHCSSSRSVLDLAESALSDFRFATLGRDNANMSEFVNEGAYYTIRLFQLSKSPILWIAKHVAG